MGLEKFVDVQYGDEQRVWHMCTPGNWPGVLFKRREDFVYGMNMVGVAAYNCSRVKIFTFQLMSNHLHFVILGEEVDVLEFYSVLKRYMLRLWNNNAGVAQVKSLIPRLFLVKDRKYLQNLIAYVNRNGYVTDSSCTPFSYMWGANTLFFNGLRKYISKVPFKSLTIRDRRLIFRKRDLELPSDWFLTDGYISPECYCHIDAAESCFMSAHHYFSIISKGVESFVEMAKELGDTIFYTDNELYRVVANICIKEFGCSDAALLAKNSKISLAVKLRKEYNAGVKQLSRILKLDNHIVESLFPKFG